MIDPARIRRIIDGEPLVTDHAYPDSVYEALISDVDCYCDWNGEESDNGWLQEAVDKYEDLMQRVVSKIMKEVENGE